MFNLPYLICYYLGFFLRKLKYNYENMRTYSKPFPLNLVQ